MKGGSESGGNNGDGSDSSSHNHLNWIDNVCGSKGCWHLPTPPKQNLPWPSIDDDQVNSVDDGSSSVGSSHSDSDTVDNSDTSSSRLYSHSLMIQHD